MELSPFLGGVKTLSFFFLGGEVLFPLGREILFPSGRGDTLSFVWKGKGRTLSSFFFEGGGVGELSSFFCVGERGKGKEVRGQRSELLLAVNLFGTKCPSRFLVFEATSGGC